MSLWVMERSSDAPGVYFNRPDLVAKINSSGVDLGNVRSWFLRLSESADLDFSMVNAAGDVQMVASPVDVLFWSWVPILSLRAKELFISLGCSEDDFIACTVGRDEVCCAHLPRQGEDVFDFSKSSFSMLIPMTPPLPFGIMEAVMKSDRNDVPSPCIFRSKIPRHGQVLSELFVCNDVLNGWKDKGMSGAVFRQVCGRPCKTPGTGMSTGDAG